ncbi:uncharacterized protein LOC129590166 [Paramacrobiotus metropolitanus]|uniref:uncharacterized protein LOC129590166 n=1 Tax=Paramacrobiotus metropolitanus TaxID=2943436 RepID=UPI002445D093|nr:uncharacterized protein LOC129590166 [Paramacrobiotus metropolitanus]
MHILVAVLVLVVVAVPEISAGFREDGDYGWSNFDNAFGQLAPRVAVYDYPVYRPFWGRNRLYAGSRRSNSAAAANGDAQVDYGTVDSDNTVLTSRGVGFASGRSSGRGYGARISSSAASSTDNNKDYGAISWF